MYKQVRLLTMRSSSHPLRSKVCRHFTSFPPQFRPSCPSVDMLVSPSTTSVPFATTFDSTEQCFVPSANQIPVTPVFALPPSVVLVPPANTLVPSESGPLYPSDPAYALPRVDLPPPFIIHLQSY